MSTDVNDFGLARTIYAIKSSVASPEKAVRTRDRKPHLLNKPATVRLGNCAGQVPRVEGKPHIYQYFQIMPERVLFF